MTDRPFSREVDNGDRRGVSPALDPGEPVDARIDGRTALMLAAAQDDHVRVAKLLGGGADVRALDDHVGAAALHFAATAGAVNAARLLLEHGAPLNLQVASHGATAIMTAVWHRRPPMVELLLARPEINVHLRSCFGATAMDLVEADAVTGKGEKRTAQHRAEDVQRIAAALESHLAHLRERQDSQRLIALLSQNNLEDSEIAAQAKTLLEIGEDVNQTAPNSCSGNDGHTPLLIAARDGCAQTVQVLLDAGADIRRTDTYMQAHAAHKAAYNGHANVLRLLAAHPDFPAIRDARGPFNGYTALHDAVWHGHIEAAGALLDGGADPRVAAHDGKRPADLAKAYGYDDVFALIQAASERQM